MPETTYLDHAATTPIRAEVLAAMEPVLRTHFGNPSSVHAAGRKARALVEEARDRVAGALGANRREVYFTSGGTEANNIALLGGDWATPGGRVIVSAIEHKAVLGAAKHAARHGAELVVVAVDQEAQLDVAALEHALVAAPSATLVSVMWGNNEVGALQPVHQAADRCRERGVLFHTDAVQAFGRVPVRVDQASCDLLTISGHKIGAPKGIGALFVRQGIALTPRVHGGGQERELRPGTENVAGAVALGVAAELAAREQASEGSRMSALRNRLEQRIRAEVPDATINAGGADRLPHISNISFVNVELESLLMSLDLEGVAVSSGSACQSGGVDPSHVLVAMNRAAADAAPIRFSLGRTTTEAEIDQAVSTVVRVVNRIRQMAHA